MMTKRPDFKTFKQKMLQDEEVRLEYERLRPEFEIMIKLIKARQQAHCSQLELAERLDLQQPAIARLEKGGYATTSISKLAKIADALGYSLKLSLSPKGLIKKTVKKQVAKTKIKKV